MKYIYDVVERFRKRCVECKTTLDLKRWSSCPDGWVCNGCAHAFGYTAYQPSLR